MAAPRPITADDAHRLYNNVNETAQKIASIQSLIDPDTIETLLATCLLREMKLMFSAVVDAE